MNVTSDKLLIAGAVAGLVVFAAALVTGAGVAAIYASGVAAVAIVMFGAAALVARGERRSHGRRRRSGGRGAALARHS